MKLKMKWFNQHSDYIYALSCHRLDGKIDTTVKLETAVN